MKRTNLVLALVAAVSVAAPSVVRAAEGSSGSTSSSSDIHSSGRLLDDSKHTRPQMITAWGMFPWFDSWGIGGGARYTLPLIHDGFIKPLNDSFELEFGADVFYGDYGLAFRDDDYLGLIVPVGVRWTFHFLPTLAAYVKLGLGFQYRYFFDDVTRRFVDLDPIDYIHWDENVGVLWKFAENMHLRGEIGYGGLRVGVGFAF